MRAKRSGQVDALEAARGRTRADNRLCARRRRRCPGALRRLTTRCGRRCIATPSSNLPSSRSTLSISVRSVASPPPLPFTSCFRDRSRSEQVGRRAHVRQVRRRTAQAARRSIHLSVLAVVAHRRSVAARAALGRFGVVGDLAIRSMVTLSGGQKSRVVLASIAFSNVRSIFVAFLFLFAAPRHVSIVSRRCCCSMSRRITWISIPVTPTFVVRLLCAH